MSDHVTTVGRVLRVSHLIGALVAIALTLALPRRFVWWMVGFWSVMVASFLVCKGCCITRLERYLTQEDVTIVDPFLSFLTLPHTARNRDTFTLITGILMLFISLLRIT